MTARPLFCGKNSPMEGNVPRRPGRDWSFQPSPARSLGAHETKPAEKRAKIAPWNVSDLDTSGGRGGSSHAQPTRTHQHPAGEGPQASDPGGDPAAHGHRAHGPGRRHPAAGLPVQEAAGGVLRPGGGAPAHQDHRQRGRRGAGPVRGGPWLLRQVHQAPAHPAQEKAGAAAGAAGQAGGGGRAGRGRRRGDRRRGRGPGAGAQPGPAPGQVFHPVRGHGPGPGA